MAEEKINIRELSFDELQEHLLELKQQAFRAKQVFEWLWKKKCPYFRRNVKSQFRIEKCFG